jgi:hypothetical protein
MDDKDREQIEKEIAALDDVAKAISDVRVWLAEWEVDWSKFTHSRYPAVREIAKRVITP